MISSAMPNRRTEPALTRLESLARLDRDSRAALEVAIAHATPAPMRAEILVEGNEIAGSRMIVSGWAGRAKIMPDGRRQFMSFLLPGDFIGLCRQPRPLAVSTVVALTSLTLCTPPSPDLSPSIATAYAMSLALEEAYLLAHIVRLGRLHAQERIADLLLELHERLTLNGMTNRGRFEVPLTQEMLGDALGLTSVHVNRMLQALRRDGDLEWQDKLVTLRDPLGLAHRIGRAPVRVSAVY